MQRLAECWKLTSAAVHAAAHSFAVLATITGPRVIAAILAHVEIRSAPPLRDIDPQVHLTPICGAL